MAQKTATVTKLRQLKVLTGAVRRLQPGNINYRFSAQSWQKRSWDLYDLVGEVRFAAIYMGDAFSRLRLFAGWVPDQNSNPMPVDDPNDLPEGANANTAKIAQEILERLNNPQGTEELQRAIGVNLFQTGECFLIGKVNPEDGEEEYDIYSTEQVEVKDRRIVIKDGPNTSSGKELTDEEALILRIWRRHPRWPEMADAAMRPAIALLEELLILTQSIRATAMSRMPAGMLLLPDSLDVGGPPDPTTSSQDGEGTDESLLDSLMAHMSEPIKDPNSASAVVPLVMQGNREDIDSVKHIIFERPIDAQAVALRQELLQRFAATVDLPPEVITGKANLNHWSAWNVDESAFANHIAPLAALMCNALTHGVLIPRLESAGIQDAEKYAVWFDPTDLVVEGDTTDLITKAHELYLISDQAARDRLGIAEEEAPEPEEIAARIQRNKRQVEGARQPSNDNAPPEEEPALQVASGAMTIDLGAEEQTLLTRLQAEANVYMKRALEKVGAKLRSVMQAKMHADELANSENIPNEELVSVFPKVFASSNIDEKAILASVFAQYGEQWDKLTKHAQNRLIELVRGGLSDSDVAEATQLLDQSRNEARTALIAALVVLGTGLIFNPHPDAPEVGEFDPNSLVPPGVVRASLGRAGGSPVPINPDSPGSYIDQSGRVVTGFYTSKIALGLYAAAGLLAADTFRWVCGQPMQPFPPHHRLCAGGTVFSGWNDVRLTNHEGFPRSSFFYPGDHRGCQCSVRYELTISGPRGSILKRGQK